MNEDFMYYHKSSKALKCFNKCWNSSQLHVQWWMNSFVSPQNIIVYKNMIHMFTLHIYPTATQITCQHCDKIYTWTSKVISNNHIVSFVIWKNTVNSSILGWGDINIGENSALGKEDADLPIVGVLLCYFENERPFHLLATTSCRPTTCIGRLHNVVSTHSRHVQKAWTRRLGTN
jgi:hypothetical protein